MLAREDNKVDESTDTMKNQGRKTFLLDEEEKWFLKAHRLSGSAKIPGILEFVDTMIESKLKLFKIYR